MSSFEDFFRKATDGCEPYGYQARLARDGLPDVVQAPTGSGKTAIILAWLWRRLCGPDPDRTPRRLIYALPQRSLVEQVAEEVIKWLRNLDLSESVALHVVMSGAGASQRQWRLDMHHPAVVVGTVDSLVSKALNRGYGIGRATYPIDFALVTNGAHWVIDEIQLCPESTTTLRQLAAFSRQFGVAEPFGLTCMSATIPERLLGTVDNPGPVTNVQRIESADRIGELARRLGAARRVRRLPAEPGDSRAIAAGVRKRHRRRTLTLVVVNTVEGAKAIYEELRGDPTPCTLLHSRFRGYERGSLLDRVRAAPGEAGHIVVSTQVVEAGIDIDAAVLVTEVAPWPSVVQRAGRCNRKGLLDDAELWWFPAKPKQQPYPADDLAATAAALTSLEGATVTGEDLLAQEVATTDPELTVLRRADILALFDTAPDLSGADLDIAPYVRDADELDVQLAWAVWEPSDPDGRPPGQAKTPEAQWRCRVPVGLLSELAGKVPVWRFDQVLGRWAAVSRRQPARPGEVLVIAAKDGGYDPETGFDPSVRREVPDCPPLLPVVELGSGDEDAYREDSGSVAQRQWVSLTQHSEETRHQADALLNRLLPDLPDPVRKAVVTAAYLHDVGKAHKTWQDALCALAPAERRPEIDAGRPWAKSDSAQRLEFAGGAQFRHELASLLFLDGPLHALLSGVEEADLVRYLVLAHHGKLRVQVRDPDGGEKDMLLGLREGETVAVAPVLGQPGGDLTVDLSQFALGGARSWTRTALELRDRFGPFVLAYLEAVVRIADWRASGNLEVPS
jgi:CRISPR-associated endonuclease/helicase Cas3